MALYFSTTNPQALLNAFDARIKQAEAKGKITTWEKVDGHYTHRAEEWSRKAFFKPIINGSVLTFNIIKPKGANISTVVYGYYHGHLIETFLNHFDQSFSTVSASPLCAEGDRCSVAA